MLGTYFVSRILYRGISFKGRKGDPVWLLTIAIAIVPFSKAAAPEFDLHCSTPLLEGNAWSKLQLHRIWAPHTGTSYGHLIPICRIVPTYGLI